MLRPSLVLSLLAVAAAAVGVGACAEVPSGPSTRTCASAIWAEPLRPGRVVEVIGSWDDWTAPLPMVRSGTGDWQVLPLELPPGEFGYRISEDGVGRLDPRNPLSTYRGEREVSLLIVADCSSPALRIDGVDVGEQGAVTVRGTFLRAKAGPSLDAASLRATGAPGVDVVAVSSETGTFSLAGVGLGRGKHTLVVEADDVDGRSAEPARAVAWVDPAMDSWADGVLYQIVVDRYRGDGGAALSAPKAPGSRAGGTLDGVRAELEKGTFDALGVTALWLSPVYENPEEAREGQDGHLYEGYHGYWPGKPREVDPRLGGALALHALIEAAHLRGIRVLFDLVPNHVYETSERYLGHRDDGWFHDGPSKCVCGTPGCGWGSHLQTCWFTPYLPDVRWESHDAMRAGVDDAQWWATTFDADGVRIDAVPMMPRAATRRIAAALRGRVEPRGSMFVAGEVFTGPGAGGIEAIRYFMGPNGLDSAFDFPLMWALRDAVATDRAGFDAVDGVLALTEQALQGSGAVPARMLDNHDTSRFLSEANGDGAASAWSVPAAQPADPTVYARHRMALALLFTLPGLPVLYYGDEIGLAGGGDPDSRRVMPNVGDILPQQAGVLEVVKRLGALRRCAKALRTGTREPLVVSADAYAYARDAGDGLPAVALFSRAASPAAIPLPDTVPVGDYVDVFSGAAHALAGGESISLDPLSFKILIPAASPCLGKP